MEEGLKGWCGNLGMKEYNALPVILAQGIGFLGTLVYWRIGPFP